ncbi:MULTISPECIES: FAD-binding oxidoreductase [unclassified Crossiella]|uniref:NAD(P)/FAD-dependent oxidoreductase n=1 Tax=unclassified Crossiella TaxID=2620835 RepID=UPI001FFF6263|nr:MULTISPECIES: FAD-dependent oxidoreductase [unclassified Crossiella]MCK2243533.1 FAD-dependent oxidoreductase [Crossiella sp. S99.2]MCK2257391.1 FAD-dependent oxidoreductase [Crossiella sp. S99.1]
MAEHRRELDVAVIGAGVLGLATTDALVRRGVSVTCFDGRPPGHGLSGGLTRTFRHRHDNERLVALAVEGRAGFGRWEERLGRKLIGPEGAVYAGMGPADVAGMVRHGVAHRFADPGEGKKVFPALATVDGPLLVDPGAGAIRARRTIDALASWVGDRIVNADIHSVTVPGDGHGVEIQTTEAIYRARHVVICAGTAVPKLAAGVGLDVPLESALHARPHYRVREPFRGKALPCWVDRSGAFGETVYGSPIGNRDTYVLGLIGLDVDIPFGPNGALAPGSGMEDHVRRVTEYVRRAMPGLEPDPIGIRVCVMTKLPAGSDAVHAWHTDGVTAIAGHNLFKMAPVLGELLADAAIKNQLPEILERAGAHALHAA